MRKRLIASILAVVMAVSSLQVQTVSVLAKNSDLATEEAALAMEEGADVEDAEAESGVQEEEAVEDAEAELGMQEEEAVEDAETEAGMLEEESADENTELEPGTQEESDTENAEEDEAASKVEDVLQEDEEDPNIAEESEMLMVTTAAVDDIASGTYTENGSNISWVIDADGKLTVEGTGDFAGHDRFWSEDYGCYYRSPWFSYSELIVSAEIKVTGMTDASYMFYRCDNLTSLDVSWFDTSQVTDMTDMFSGCSSLTNLDVSGFDTSRVTDMREMFRECDSLVRLDVSGFNTSQVTSMTFMFYECSSLTSLDLSGFDTSKVTYMTCMFEECSSLTDLDLSGFDTSRVEGMDYMFYGCSSLTSLDLSRFDASQADFYMGGMFWGCSSLEIIYTPYNLRRSVKLPYGADSDIWYSYNGTEITELPQNLSYSIVIMKNEASPAYYIVAFTGAGKDAISEGTPTRVKKGADYTFTLVKEEGWTYEVAATMGGKPITLAADETGNTYTISNVTDQLVITIVKTVDGIIASGAYEHISWAIDGNGKLTVKGTGEFAGSDRSLDNPGTPWYSYRESIISAEIKVTGMTNASYMFCDCYNLASLDVSEFDTSRVTSMSYMFSDCNNNLTSLDVSGFDTSQVTDMSDMFSMCSSLKNLDVSGFDTSRVTNMGAMFQNCSSLTSLDVSGFDTSQVTNMNWMFYGCSSLLALDVSGFDVSSIVPASGWLSLAYMFCGCSSLTSLDLSSFDVSKLVNDEDTMLNMLLGCSSLEMIYTPYNVHVWFTELPYEEASDVWYDCNGNQFKKLPQDLSYSLVLMKNKIPPVSSISAAKTKTLYRTGETLNIDDLKVYYYDDKGAVMKVSEGYITNASKIDMSTPGTKVLEITYNDMTTEMELFVGVYTVTFIGSGKDDVTGEASKKAEEGTDYTFKLARAKGYTYTVTAVMGTESIIPVADETGNIYTIPNVTANLIITIKKTQDQISELEPEPEDTSGLKIKFIHEEDRESTYTGKAIQPEMKVTYNGKNLTAGVDYTIKYSNNTKIGTAKITITGKGNFSKGNSQTTFRIVEKNIKDQDITLCGVSVDKDGKEILSFANAAKLAPVLYYNNIKLTGKDYVVKDVSGNVITNKKLRDSDNGVTIKIEGKSGGNFTGSREVTLNVVDKKNLTKFTATIDKTKLSTLTYDGKAHYIHEISGALTVTAKNVDKTKMEYGRDYTIVYQSDLTGAGTKKFTVVGMGLYTGSISKSYTIKPAKDNVMKVAFDGEVVTENKIRDQIPFVSAGITFSSRLAVVDDSIEELLTEGRDYKISYSGNKKANQNAKCTITFLGSYKGHAKLTIGFEIVQADLSAADVIIADQLYKNKAGIYKSVPYVIADKNGINSLVSSSNYKITYYIQDPTNNADALQMKGRNKVGEGDTVWVKLEAKGKNYSGMKIVSYKVRQAQDLSKAKITFQDADGNPVKNTAYTGNKITSGQIKTVVDGKLAENDADLEVIYINNINKGKATVIIKGTDTDGCKYVGCKKATFSIVARNLNILDVLFKNISYAF